MKRPSRDNSRGDRSVAAGEGNQAGELGATLPPAGLCPTQWSAVLWLCRWLPSCRPWATSVHVFQPPAPPECGLILHRLLSKMLSDSRCHRQACPTASCVLLKPEGKPSTAAWCRGKSQTLSGRKNQSPDSHFGARHGCRPRSSLSLSRRLLSPKTHVPEAGAWDTSGS